MSVSHANSNIATETGVTRLRMYIGGQWRDGTDVRAVFDPYRGERVALCPESSLQDLDDALAAATAAKAKAAAMPGFERAALLRRVGALLVERAESIAEVMSRETGKALKDSRSEVIRSQDTILLSAEEAIRIQGSRCRWTVRPWARASSHFCCVFP